MSVPVARGEKQELAAKDFRWVAFEPLKGPLEAISRVHGFLPAFAAFFSALALHWLFVLLFGQNFAGIFFVYLAAMIIAGWCGYLPGATVVLVVAILPSFLFKPNFSIRDINPSGVVVLLMVSLMISRAAASRREAEARLQAMNDELERRVKEKTSELAKANASLHAHVNELLRANADLQQFAYSASHDLQEPLRMVSIFTQLLQKKFEGQLGEEADEYILHAVNGALRMETLIHGLRSYITVSVTSAPPEPVDSAVVLRHSLDNLDGRIGEAGASVEFHSLPVIRIHKIHLQQLFQNILSNAIKYRSHDAPHIRISARNDGDCWIFAVQDNGIGIKPEYAEHIFGVFKRLHGQEEYEGIGIGLAICKKIVERYGGQIWVESELGKGSSFYFTIPIT